MQHAWHGSVTVSESLYWFASGFMLLGNYSRLCCVFVAPGLGVTTYERAREPFLPPPQRRRRSPANKSKGCRHKFKGVTQTATLYELLQVQPARSSFKYRLLAARGV